MIRLITKFVISIIYFILVKIKYIRSASQEGEDLIIDRILKTNNIKFKDIFYLDIGAGHPIKYSNTFYFYLRGSTGITVDAFKKNISLHKIFRPRDISFNLLLGDKDEYVDFFLFKESELNTSNKIRLDELKKQNIYSHSSIKIKKVSINNFIKNNIKEKLNKVNFLNIDIEGGDLEIIQLIDWNILQPKVICVEIFTKNMNEIYESEIYNILKSNGYLMNSKMINSVIFIKK